MYKILIAEDDSAVRFIYSKMNIWNECGFTIEKMVSNGKAALESLMSYNYDLIITDIRMPFIDGIELLREIKKQNIDTDVVFASSYDDFEYVRQGLILGAFDYILKPVKNNELEKILIRAKEKLDERRYSETADPCIKVVFDRFNVPLDSSFNENVYSFLASVGSKVITMEDAAENLGFSKDYFGKIFKQNFGVSFKVFYSAVKIEYAKVLIKTSSYKTYQISDMLGYSSPDYFTKIFKEATGMTPSEYKTENMH